MLLLQMLLVEFRNVHSSKAQLLCFIDTLLHLLNWSDFTGQADLTRETDIVPNWLTVIGSQRPH